MKRQHLEQVGGAALLVAGGALLAKSAVIAGVLLVLGVVFQAVALSRAERTLEDEAIALARRIRRCSPGWWRLPDPGPYSALGLIATGSRYARQINEYGWRRKVWRPARPYTRLLHRRLCHLIERLADAPYAQQRFGIYLERHPDPDEYVNLARDLRAAVAPPDVLSGKRGGSG